MRTVIIGLVDIFKLEDGKIVEQTSQLRLLSPAGGHPA